MTPQPLPGQEPDTSIELSDGPGRRLRVARQAQGLKLDQIADGLHLSTTVVESLEHDDYAALPSQVFVVGYIQKYARLVGLDPAPLLTAYRTVAPQVEPARPGTARISGGQVGSGHLIVRLVSIGILILLATLSFLWWQGRQPVTELETADTNAEQEPEAAAMLEPAPEIPTSPFSESNPIEVLGDNLPPEPESALQVPEPQPSPATAEQQDTAASKPAATGETNRDNTSDERITTAEAESTTAVVVGENPEATEDNSEATAATAKEIVVSFDGPCWVDVRDSERKFKLFGEMKKGDSHILAGKPPYSVILGNAAAARISIGGTDLDLTTLSRGNVARFTLDPDNMP